MVCALLFCCVSQINSINNVNVYGAKPPWVSTVYIDFGESLANIDQTKLNGWKLKTSDVNTIYLITSLSVASNSVEITIPFGAIYELTGKHFKVPYTYNEVTTYFDENNSSGKVYPVHTGNGWYDDINLVAKERTPTTITVNVTFDNLDKNKAITSYLCLNYVYKGGFESVLLTQDNLSTSFVLSADRNSVRLELNFPVYSQVSLTSGGVAMTSTPTNASSYAEYYIDENCGAIQIIVKYIDNGYFVGTTIY